MAHDLVTLAIGLAWPAVIVVAVILFRSQLPSPGRRHAFVDIEDTRSSGAAVRHAVGMRPSVGRVHSMTIPGLPTSVYRVRAYSDDPNIRSATTLFVVLADAPPVPTSAGD
jgi:hypothetical protein